MIKKIKDINLLLKSKLIMLILIFTILFSICIGYIIGNTSNKQVEKRLDGYWNVVVDSLVIKRNTKVKFETLNFYFSSETVKLPLIQIPQIDFKGKTLLDADIDNDSLDKYERFYQKAECESHGIWRLSNTKDSIDIQAISHPLNGSYKLCFFKTQFWGQEHYFMRMSNDSTYIVCENFFLAIPIVICCMNGITNKMHNA